MSASTPLREYFPDGVFAAGCPSRTVLDHVMSKWGLLVLLAPLPRAHALEWQELWQRPDQRGLKALEAEEADSAEQARAMAQAKAQLDERAAEVGSKRADLDVRTAGIADREQFLRTRLTEVEQRLEGTKEARREAEVRRVAQTLA